MKDLRQSIRYWIMKKWITAVIILTGVLSVSTCFVHNAHHTVLFGGKPLPRIFVRNSVVDLGTIRSSEKPKRISFEIVNIGKAPLKITKIFGRCPCLNLNLDRSTIAPKRNAQLSATVRALPSPGKWHDIILVYSNDPMNPITKLEVKAHVELVCLVLPSPVVVENLEFGEVREAAFEIMGPSNDDSFRVLGVSTTTDAIRVAEIKELDAIDQVKRKKWKAKIRVEHRGMSDWQENLTISTSDPSSPEWEVLVKVGEILPLSIIPRTVCLKCSVNNQSPSAIVKIIHNSKAMQGEISNIKSPKWLKIIKNRDSDDGSVRLLLKVLPEFIPKLSIISGNITANVGLNAFPVDIPVLVFTQQ